MTALGRPTPHVLLQYCVAHSIVPDMDFDEALAGGIGELRRGTVVLASLLLLRTPGYGYALLEDLRDLGFTVDANTLYPLLRRLESQGMLVSAWNTEEARPRKFYRTSDAGIRLADTLTDEWRSLTSAISGLTPEEN